MAPGQKRGPTKAPHPPPAPPAGATEDDARAHGHAHPTGRGQVESAAADRPPMKRLHPAGATEDGVRTHPAGVTKDGVRAHGHAHPRWPGAHGVRGQGPAAHEAPTPCRLLKFVRPPFRLLCFPVFWLLMI
ncbi:unnamed protein product [Urochloa humidicola]